MEIEVRKITPADWSLLAEKAHLVVFNEHRPHSMNRIDYALLAAVDGSIHGYITVKELDSESVYWQYGGAFPSCAKSLKSVRCFEQFLNYTKEHGYKRVSMLVKNDNFSMLKFALHLKFIAIGIRNFDGDILLEMHKNLQGVH